jgi:hypothetical protein
MSLYYDLTPYVPNTFFLRSWLFSTFYDHTFSFPPTPVDITHGGECVEKESTKQLFFKSVRYISFVTTWSVALFPVFAGDTLTN